MASRRAASAATFGATIATLVVFAVQAIALMPMYLRALGPTLYGAWLGSGDVLMWLQAVDLGLPNLLIQRVAQAHGSGDERGTDEVFASVTVVLIAFALLIAGTGLALADYLPRANGLQGADAQAFAGSFRVASIAVAAAMANNAVVGFSRGVQRTGFLSAATIVAGVVGIVTSVVMLKSGYGLWSIGWGMAARSAILVLGSLAFVLKWFGSRRLLRLRARRRVLRELLTISPATALGGLAYAVMNQSQTALVSFLIAPEAAVAFSFTRKMSDLGRAVLDTIGTSVYGSFAHLIQSRDMARSPEVHARIRALYYLMATGAAVGIIVFNGPFVARWAGPARYAGDLLNVLFALQMIILGAAYLDNYLYRATGAIQEGSWLLVGEAVIRIVLMVALIRVLGEAAPVVGACATAIWFGMVAKRRTLDAMTQKQLGRVDVPEWTWLVRASVLAAAALSASYVRTLPFALALLVATAMGLLALLVAGVTDPIVRNLLRTELASRRMQVARG